MPRKTKQNNKKTKQNNKKTQKKEIVLFISPMNMRGGVLNNIKKLLRSKKNVVPETVETPYANVVDYVSNIVAEEFKKMQPNKGAKIQKKNIWYVRTAPNSQNGLMTKIDSISNKIDNSGEYHRVLIDGMPYLVKYGKMPIDDIEKVKQEFQDENITTTVIPAETVALNDIQEKIKNDLNLEHIEDEELIPELNELNEPNEPNNNNENVVVPNNNNNNNENVVGQGGKNKKSKKTNKVRKHRGIVQTGGSAGRLRKGYKYTGRRLKNGQAEIKKVKQTRK